MALSSLSHPLHPSKLCGELVVYRNFREFVFYNGRMRAFKNIMALATV